MNKAVALLVLIPALANAADHLAALSMIETGNNDRMVGRAGEISRYQILKGEWRRITNSTRYQDPQTARAVAVTLLNQRVATFQRVLRRPPSSYEVYALWNAPSQVLRGRLSPRVAERCRRFANLCEAADRMTLPPSGRPALFAQLEPPAGPARRN